VEGEETGEVTRKEPSQESEFRQHTWDRRSGPRHNVADDLERRFVLHSLWLILQLLSSLDLVRGCKGRTHPSLKIRFSIIRTCSKSPRFHPKHADR